jgi:ribosomal protein S18 acetylase RimI-like enzyme
MAEGETPYIRMRRQLHLPIVPAPLPPGVNLIPFSRAAVRAGREVMRRAYDGDLGDRGNTFEGFWEWLTNDAEFDPALIFIAEADGEVVGLCHCWTGNFVKDLVVDAPFRRRGLGAALLTVALREFARRGAGSVDLKTSVENAAAQSLYRRLGFEAVEGS